MADTEALKTSLAGIDLTGLAGEVDKALGGVLAGLEFVEKFPIVGDNATLHDLVSALTFAKSLLDKVP